MTLNKDFNIDKLIKEKLQDFSFDTQPQGWDIVNKGIKAHKQKMLIKKTALISAIILVVAGAIYFANNQNAIIKNTDKKVNNNLVKKAPKKQTTQNNIVKNNISKQQHATKNKTNYSKTEEQHTTNKTLTTQQNKNKNNLTDNVQKQDSEQIKESRQPVIINNILPNADFITDYKKGCQPLNVKFLPVEKSDTMIYYWNFGDGITSNKQSPSHTYTQSGKFTVSLTVKYYRTGEIISKSYHDLIEVYSLPKSDFDFTNQGSKYYFTNKSINSKTNIWLGFDEKIITEKSPEYNFSKNKTYTISLVSINKNGCSDTLTKQITVNSIEQITLFMPNAFTPDGDGINDYFGVTQPLEYKEFYMQIFDLQGNLLYLSNNKQKMWDGKNKQNKPVPSGKYIWKVLIKTKKGNKIQKTGYLNLIK